MKTHLLRLAFTVIVFCGIFSQKSYGQFTFTGNTSGASSPATIRNGQTGLVLYGFNATNTSGSAKPINRIYLSNTNNNQGYFTSGKLYYSTNGTFASASPLSGVSVGFYNNSVDISNVSISIPNLATYSFFLVADMDVSYGSIPNTLRFNLTSLVNEPTGSTYTNGSTALTNGTSYSLAAPTIALTNLTSGITAGPVNYGQNDVVVFGFSVTVTGKLTTNQINFNTANNIQSIFSNVRLYRSTTSTSYPTGFGSSVATAAVEPKVIKFSQTENFPGNATTINYFIVADYTGTCPLSTTLQFVIDNTQSPAFFVGPSNVSYTPSNNISGTNYNIGVTYNWRGGTSVDWANLNNYSTLCGGAPSVLPGVNDNVQIGVVSYTNPAYQPTVSAATTVNKITFGSNNTPTLTINSGIALTASSGIVINAGASPTIKSSSATPASTAATLNTGGTSSIASTATLKLDNKITLANSGTFTLNSDASGSAGIAELPSVASITGTFNVQRYFTGNSANSRGYRLVSSPVSAATNNLVLPNLTYIYNNAYLTGTSGNTNGFDAAGNPTLYFYREDMAPNITSFITGNFRGVSKINNSNLYSFSLNNEASAYTLPAGNGFLFFFRGDKATTSNPTVTTTIAKPGTFTATGVLNQGSITVKHWTTGSNGLLYTSATANTKIRGYNLVGNPYASSIDWDKFGTGITGTNISNKIYIYNPTLKAYAIYQKGNAGIGTNFNGPTGTANIIPSGQGFFVVATNPNPTLTFTEAVKVSTQVTSTTLLMSTSAVKEKEASVQYVHLQLYKDSLNSDESLIFFKGGAKTEFDDNEDAEYLAGNNLVNLSSLSADQRQLAINRLAYPKTRQPIALKTKIYLNGTYQLNIKALKNIPANYTVWLMDNFKKDSLDIRANKTYSFNAVTTDTTTFANRFAIVIGKNPAYNLRLLDFKAVKGTSGSQLSWITENEYDDTYFAIERSIDDGKTFEMLGTSQSTSKGTYALADKFPVIGVNKYRLRVEDIDGTVTYSKTLSLTYTNTVNNVVVNNANINIFPNPVASTVNVAIAEKAGTASNSYTINITNGLGNVMKTATTSQLTWNGNINNWLPGSYFVQVVDNTTKAIIGNGKFVKN